MHAESSHTGSTNFGARIVNAFALPGGHVSIGEGLIKLMQSEDALAAVLGHEVEHIDLRHCADRVQTEGRLRSWVPSEACSAFPWESFTAGCSGQQELEADKEGTALAVAFKLLSTEYSEIARRVRRIGE